MNSSKVRYRDQGQGAKRGTYIEIEYRVWKYTNINTHHTGVGARYIAVYIKQNLILQRRDGISFRALCEREAAPRRREREVARLRSWL